MICDLTSIATRIRSSNSFTAKITFVNCSISGKQSCTSSFKATSSYNCNIKSIVAASSNVDVKKSNFNFGLSEELRIYTPNSMVRVTSSYSAGVKQRVSQELAFLVGVADKFNGNPVSFLPHEKLYPTGNIIAKIKETNEDIILNGDYDQIDEGVFAGQYTAHNAIGHLLTDDSSSIIFTNLFDLFDPDLGDINIKFDVTTPLSTPTSSYLAIRANAPFANYMHRRPHYYKIYDIKLEDPYGNLIIKYHDINIGGDENYTTFVSAPEQNNVLLYSWDSDYPIMGEDSGYTLSMSIGIVCDQGPFLANKFDNRFDQSCINQGQTIIIGTSFPDITVQPINNLHISAIEIGNSGCVGIKKDDRLSLFSNAVNTSKRIEKEFFPISILPSGFTNDLYPNSSTKWKSTIKDIDYYNDSYNSAASIVQAVRNDNQTQYITLLDSSVQGSGRLVLKFNTEPYYPSYPKKVSGAFSIGRTEDFQESKTINSKNYPDIFDADSVELKIIARKASESDDDYFIDVVGYSDDKLLNKTSPINGFIQNDDDSTYYDSYLTKKSFGLSHNPISDISEYIKFTTAGDHYTVSESVVVNTASFEEYTIPLKINYPFNIYDKTRYSFSTFFENLILDICPLPIGAEICQIKLVVKYKPSNAITLNVLGGASDKDAGYKDIKLYPNPHSSFAVNSKLPLTNTKITGFKSPNDIKYNYSRRWRGINGKLFSGGDFQYNQFDFSFNHEIATHPFYKAYLDFKNISSASMLSAEQPNIHFIANNTDGDIITLSSLSNFGWRYSSDQLLDIPTDYKSIAWANNVFDAFDSAVKLESDENLESTNVFNYVYQNDIDRTNGFAIYLKYTPDHVLSSDLENHLIFSNEKTDGSDWFFALMVENNRLKFKVNNVLSTVLTDTIDFSSYTFPLSVVITYNDLGDRRFKLYTSNDGESRFNNLRNKSSAGNEFYSDGQCRFYINYSSILTNQTIPLFIHEFGCVDTFCNIVEYYPYSSYNVISAKDFFDSSRMHYAINGNTTIIGALQTLQQNTSPQYSYIDDDNDSWHLGDFKVSEFSPAFDFLTTRGDADFLNFQLDHHGSGYHQTTDLTLPNNIDLSGVAYHTQIENDFLRFDLSTIPYADYNRFYAVPPRISKNIPAGYQFNDRIIVETILSHSINDDVVWNNGASGAKFIVSLYAPSKDDYNRPSEEFGLVSRSIHPMSDTNGIIKLTSKLSYNDIVDESEPWANFNRESYIREFSEKYYSKDIDYMFLQYDIIYPSGSPISSTINIHNANIKLDKSIFFYDDVNNSLNIYSNGEKYRNDSINLFCMFSSGLVHEHITLFTNSHPPSVDKVNLYNFCNTYNANPKSLNLYSLTIGSIGSYNYGENFGGIYDPPILNLYVSGQWMSETSMPMYSNTIADIPSSSINMFVDGWSINYADSLNLLARGGSTPINYRPYASMSLFVSTPAMTDFVSVDNYIPLYINCYNPSIVRESGGMNLFTLNYPISPELASKKTYVSWNSTDIGYNITDLDNKFAYVDADDNIRGVDLSCYGDCKK